MTEKHIQSDTKHKIFEIAAELFARDGFYKTSVREICDAAGVTKPVLYYYFKDKEALLEALMNETVYHTQELKQKHINIDSPLADMLRGIVNLYINFIDAFPHLVKFSALIQSTNVPEKIRQMKLERYRIEMGEFISLLIKAQRKGVVDASLDSTMLAQNFIGSVMIIILECVLLEDKQCNLNSKLNEFVEFWIKNFIKTS